MAKIISTVVGISECNEEFGLLSSEEIYQNVNVAVLETDDKYYVIKNKWKYCQDITKCRDIKGKTFELTDLDFVRVKANEYLHDNVYAHSQDEVIGNLLVDMRKYKASAE